MFAPTVIHHLRRKPRLSIACTFFTTRLRTSSFKVISCTLHFSEQTSLASLSCLVSNREGPRQVRSQCKGTESFVVQSRGLQYPCRQRLETCSLLSYSPSLIPVPQPKKAYIQKVRAIAGCYGLKVYVSPNSYMTIFRDRTFIKVMKFK